MNLQLMDPRFRNTLPEYIESTLEDGLARCGAFNHKATLLAIGCNDGRIVIWDFDTQGIAKVLVGHVHPVTSVSWSRNYKKLLSSSSDWTVILWDVYNGTQDVCIQFDSSVIRAELHPRGKNLCLVSPWMDYPYLVNLTTKEKIRLPLYDTDNSVKKHIPSIVVASWDYKGNMIYTGDFNGVVCEINPETLNIERTLTIPGGTTIKSLVFSKDQRQMLVNCTDKIIRLFNISDFTLVHEMTDVVNKLQWKRCIFSSDGEYIIGGSAQKHEHKIYIWNRQYGQLFKFLEGPKEGILDLIWHPTRPILVSISSTGVAYIWNAHYTENWSTLAPGFTELEENEEYIEREDEFDLINEEEIVKNTTVEEVDIGEIDIMTVEKNDSDDEEEPFYLPVCIIADKYTELKHDVQYNNLDQGKKRKRKDERYLDNF